MKEKYPVVTLILVTINLAIFLFTVDFSVLPFPVQNEIVEIFGLSPQYLILKPYILITHMFVHADVIHFIGNMLMLSVVGLVTEIRIGSLKFSLFYFFCGLITIPFTFLMEFLTGVAPISIGASGAIFGVMFIAGAMAGWEEVPVILIPILNVIALPFIFFSFKNIKVPLFVAILFYLLLELIMLFMNLPMSIGEIAHFGGFLGGIIGTLLILPKSK